MEKIKFRSKQHQEFYIATMEQVRRNDVYHRALVYLLGLTQDTVSHFNEVFDFDTDLIKPECLHAGWQTGGSIRICRLALNLWNGYVEEECAAFFSPEDIFCCEFAPYFFEAIRLRYPEYNI